jgi:pullulanase
MAIDDRIVVVFNATPAATTQTIPSLADRRFALHEVQARGGDPVVKGSRASRGAFTVPGRTTAVFVSRTR